LYIEVCSEFSSKDSLWSSAKELDIYLAKPNIPKRKIRMNKTNMILIFFICATQVKSLS